MATYTIVQNGVVTNVIEALEAFIIENFDNDVAVLGRYPIGYLFKDDHFISPETITVDVANVVATSGYTDPTITVITVAAMRARLTVSEREAIRNTTDIFVRDIWDDLNSRLYVDLNDDLVVQGIAYITNYLTSVPDVFDNNVMTVIDLAARSTELVANGTQAEKYSGVL